MIWTDPGIQMEFVILFLRPGVKGPDDHVEVVDHSDDGLDQENESQVIDDDGLDVEELMRNVGTEVLIQST